MSTLCPTCGRTFDAGYRLCPFDGTALVRTEGAPIGPDDPMMESLRRGTPDLALGAPLESADVEPPDDGPQPLPASASYELEVGDAPADLPPEAAAEGPRLVEHLAARRALDRAEARSLSRRSGRSRWTRPILLLLALGTLAWLTVGGGGPVAERLLDDAKGFWEDVGRTLDSWKLDQPDPPGRRRY